MSTRVGVRVCIVHDKHMQVQHIADVEYQPPLNIDLSTVSDGNWKLFFSWIVRVCVSQSIMNHAYRTRLNPCVCWWFYVHAYFTYFKRFRNVCFQLARGRYRCPYFWWTLARAPSRDFSSSLQLRWTQENRKCLIRIIHCSWEWDLKLFNVTWPVVRRNLTHRKCI